MNIVPISDLPMPADNKSQLQVLGERKAELSEQAQVVGESKLPPQQKQRALKSIDSKSAAVRVEIRHRQQSVQAEKKAEDKRIRTKSNESRRLEQARLQKQDEKASAERKSQLDIRV